MQRASASVTRLKTVGLVTSPLKLWCIIFSFRNNGEYLSPTMWILPYLGRVSALIPSGSDLIPPGACNLLNSSTVYANNEVSLSEVDIYGFDYDYTLALYSNALNTMIYNTARSFLIEHFKVSRVACVVTLDVFAWISSSRVLCFLSDSILRASANMITSPTSLCGVFTTTSRRYSPLDHCRKRRGFIFSCTWGQKWNSLLLLLFFFI